MNKCHLEHCGQDAASRHPAHGIHLCERCSELIERFGHPRTLGDLSNLMALAVLKYGPTKVRDALRRLEDLI